MGWKMFLSDSKYPDKQFAYIYDMRVSFMFFYFHCFLGLSDECLSFIMGKLE